MKKSCIKPYIYKAALLLGMLCSAAIVHAAEKLSVEEAIEITLTENPYYRSIALGENIADLELDKVKGSRLPSLSLQGGYTHYSDPMTVYPIHQQGVFPTLDHNLYNGGLYMTMPLYTGGRISAQDRLARSEGESATWKKSALKQEMIFSTIHYLIEMATLEKARDASQKRLQFYQQESDRIDLLIENGRATKLDKAKVSALLEKATYEDIQLSAAYDSNRIALESLMNKSVPASTGFRPFGVRESKLPSSLDEAVEMAREQHPELIAAKLKVGAAVDKIAIADSERMPQVSAVGNVRRMAGGNLAGNNEWQIGLQVTVPLFDGGVRSSKVQQTYLEKEQAQLTYVNLSNQIVATVRNAYQSVTVSNQSIHVAISAHIQAQEALRIERLRFKHNRSTVNDLILAEATFWETQSNLSQAEGQLIINQAALLKAIGMLDQSSAYSLEAN